MHPEVYDFLMNKKRIFVGDKNKKTAQGFVLWLTGLSQSGKSTISEALEKELIKRNRKVERLDGDIVRESLTKDLGFTPEDRDENIRRVAFVAKLLSRNGVFVLASFITPYIRQREEIKMMVENYIEVYVNAPVEVCEKRDRKGLYEKARRGEIKNFTGVNDPFEAPSDPDLELRTDEETVNESVSRVINFLEKSCYIR